ncbi:MAG: hypothetical protein HYZ28_03130 [Myxococcales bacterium]|nr:hypothetical protein [Myxococcales bacterium]
MPMRVQDPLLAFQPSAQERRELVALRDKFVQLITTEGMVSPRGVHELLSQITRDRKITNEEMNLLAQGYRDNAQFFTPDAAMMVQQFLSNGMVPAMPAQGWVPGGAYPGEPRDLNALRQALGMALERGSVSLGDAQALISRATANPANAGQAVSILADAFHLNERMFAPDAANAMRAFLSSYQAPNAYGPAFGPGSGFERMRRGYDNYLGGGAYQPPYGAAPAYSAYGTPPAVPTSRSEQRELMYLKEDFTKMLISQGGVTPNEVQQLIAKVTKDGKLTQNEVALLSQGFRDNQQFFTPDAAMMMQNFLGTYGGAPGYGYNPGIASYPGASPYGAPMGGPVMGAWNVATPGEHPEVNALRQAIGMAFSRNEPVSLGEAQSMATRATRNRDVAPLAVRILADAFYANQGRFSPEAQQSMRYFLMQNGL